MLVAKVGACRLRGSSERLSAKAPWAGQAVAQVPRTAGTVPRDGFIVIIF